MCRKLMLDSLEEEKQMEIKNSHSIEKDKNRGGRDASPDAQPTGALRVLRLSSRSIQAVSRLYQGC
jgi:hypothetical protein